jgi:Tol biopolymer transport system component
MKKLVLVLAIFVLPVCAQSKLRLTPEQAIAIRHPGDLRWSPDGKSLAMTVSEPSKGSERLTHIWLYSTETAAVRQFTFSTKSESNARWSPDSKTLAFLSNRDEEKQIFVIPVDGGEARRLTEGKRAIQDFAWSPDGKQIAFLAPEPKSDLDEKKEKEKDDAKRVDFDDKHAWLWIADASTGKAQQVTGKPWEFRDVQWTPSGDKLIVVATDHPESDQETDRIFAVNPTNGKMSLIAAPRGPFGGVKLSPDGKQLAYVGSRVDGPQPHDLFVQPTDGGSGKNLTAQSIDRPIEAFAWLTDGRILATKRRLPQSCLCYRFDRTAEHCFSVASVPPSRPHSTLRLHLSAPQLLDPTSYLFGIRRRRRNPFRLGTSHLMNMHSSRPSLCTSKVSTDTRLKRQS